MFLHVGADVSVRTKDVIAIIDMKAAKTAVATREFLDVMKDESAVEDISEGDAKSFVVTVNRVFLSPISAPTLGKRAFCSSDRKEAF